MKVALNCQSNSFAKYYPSHKLGWNPAVLALHAAKAAGAVRLVGHGRAAGDPSRQVVGVPHIWMGHFIDVPAKAP